MKTVTRIMLFLLLMITKSVMIAQITDVFISEYVEGSSNNKALELFNGTSAPIDLTTGQYLIQVYFNGSTSATSIALTGTISAGGVFIIAHTSAVLGITPDQSSSSISFNGNDAVVLRKGGASGVVLDVIGEVGFNPGTQWGLGDTCTLDRTLRRKLFICQGEINTSNDFYVDPEWDGYPQNTFSGLGVHTASCGPSVNGLSINPGVLSFTSTTNVPSQAQSYLILGTGLTNAVNIVCPLYFELSMSASGPFTSSLSIPALSFSSTPVTAYVRYNPISIGSTSGSAVHNSSPYTLSLTLNGTATGLTPIAVIQGTATASSFTGQIISTSGIVSADYQGTNELAGFYIQDPIGDANPLSSEGIFISNTSYSVNVGDYVSVSGLVEEFFGRTQIKSLSSLTVQSTGNSINSTSVNLPFSTSLYPEQLEGMRVQFTQTLTVTEVYTLARYGEVSLSSNGRLMNPTNFIDPNDQPASGTTSSGSTNVPAVLAQQNLNDLNRILLDDKSSVQNPTLVPYIDPINNTLRCGSTLSDLNGILDYAFGEYRIQPVSAPMFTYAPRPLVPSVGAYNVKVASFNVLNYFNGDGLGGGFPTSRGANTSQEFTRQRSKIIAAIKEINADVIGLMEMENDGNSSQSAIADLVNGLNTLMGAGTYTFVTDPTPANGGTGTDEIKVALLYKPSVLSRIGASMADDSIVHNRPPLAQTFLVNANQEKFSVVVNHFKSKSCSAASGNNADQLDGQGCYNSSRKSQAGALLRFIHNVKVLAADSDVIAIGDFNAYEQEDPIDQLLSGGLQHLLNNSYSYVFSGQSGSLDHAFVSNELAIQVSGADKWHINADEPIAKDYNQEFNPAYMYSADPYRSSDHDPVLVGLKLETITTGLNGGADEKQISIASIFPNPSNQNAVRVKIVDLNSEKGTLEVLDQLGQLLSVQSFELQQGEATVLLELESNSNGIYYIRVKSGNKSQVNKFVLMREQE